MAEKGKDNLDLGKEKDAKSSKGMLIVVIVLVLVVLGMSGALLYVMGVFDGKVHGVGAPPPAAHHEEAPPPPKIPVYIPIEKDLVVNFPPGGGARLMQIGLTILVYEPAVEAVLRKHTPMLRNNLNLLLAAQDTAQLRTLEGKKALQASILEEVNKVVKRNIPRTKVWAEQVYFTSFVLQ